MDKASENIFLDLIPESDRKHFVGKTLKNPDGTYKNEMQKALQELLNGTFVNTQDGEKLTVKELIMMKTVGFTLANPSPQNVKVLCEMAGESTKVDITSDGKSIDAILGGIAINNGKSDKEEDS